MSVNGFGVLTESLDTLINDKVRSWGNKFFSTGLFVKIERGAPVLIKKNFNVKWPDEGVKYFNESMSKIEGITFTWPRFLPSFWIDKLPIGEDAKIDDATLEEIDLNWVGISDIGNLDPIIQSNASSQRVQLLYSDLEHFTNDKKFAFTYYSSDTVRYISNGRLKSQERKDWLIFSGAKIDAGLGTTDAISGKHFTLKVEAFSQLELELFNPLYVQDEFIPWVDLVSSEYLFHEFYPKENSIFEQKFNNPKPKGRSEEMTLNPNNSFGVPCPPDWIPDRA